MFYSIRTRISAAYLLLTIVAFGVVGLSVSRLVGEFLLDQRVREQISFAEGLAIEMTTPLANMDAEKMYQTAVDYGQKYGGRILVLDNEGIVNADSFSQLNGYKLDQREVSEVLSGRNYSHGFHMLDNPVLDSESNKTIWVAYFASAITQNSKVIGVLLYSNSVQDIVDRVSNVQWQIILVFLAVSLLSLVLGYFVSMLITKPIDALTQGALRISKGDFKQRIPSGGKSELSNLIDTFNMMASRLEDTDRLRNEFVSNASHELKTPLSSIKILIESLLYNEQAEPEVYKEFLLDINAEIDRLSSIISDLLLLVHIDQQDAALLKSPMPAEGILQKVVSGLLPLAKEKNIELSLNIDHSVTVMCDALKLQQAFSNLVDNAIKYTPEGGKVAVTLGDNENNAIVNVSDTGIGISEEALSHIFERFYRVDKARARDTGGTGLGLSIVQRIVSLHGGSIEVKSHENEGTVFIVYLPKQ